MLIDQENDKEYLYKIIEFLIEEIKNLHREKTELTAIPQYRKINNYLTFIKIYDIRIMLKGEKMNEQVVSRDAVIEKLAEINNRKSNPIVENVVTNLMIALLMMPDQYRRGSWIKDEIRSEKTHRPYFCLFCLS